MSWGRWAAWLLVGLMVFLRALLVPPSGDDWRRINVSDRPVCGDLDRSRRFYLERNGRVLATCSFPAHGPVVVPAPGEGGDLVGLVAVLQRVAGSRSVWGLLPAVLGVLLVPAPVFREALAWSTGFFYSVPPVVGLVLLLGTVAGC